MGDSVFKEPAPVITCEKTESNKYQEVPSASCEGTCRHWMNDKDSNENAVSGLQDHRNTNNLANGGCQHEAPQIPNVVATDEPKCDVPSCEKTQVNSMSHLNGFGDGKVCRHSSYNCLHAAREPVPLQKKIKKRRHSTEPKLQISAEMHHMLERAGVMGVGNTKYLATTPFEAVNISSVTPETQNPIKDASDSLKDEKTISKPILAEEEAMAMSDEFQKSVRQSVLDLKEVNAGKVALKVERFNTVVEEAVVTELAERQASPFRFPNSTLRTKGRSPVRVPTVFAKNDERGNRLRELAMSVAQQKTIRTAKHPVRAKANLPISTNLVRPKVVEKALTKIASAGDVVHPKINRNEDKLRRRSAEPIQPLVDNCSMDLNSNKGFIKPMELSSGVLGSPVRNQHDQERDNLQTPEQQKMRGPPPGSTPVRLVSPIVTPVQINDSLLETIDEVCTPMSEKVRRRSDKICRSGMPLQDSSLVNVPVDSPLKDDSNATKAIIMNTPQATPKILPPMVSSSVTKSILERTGGGLNTPRTAFTPKVRESHTNRHRGPVKPVKRLGSPNSPRSPKSPKKYYTSPKKYTTTKGKLSPIPAHVIDWDV